MAHTPHGDDLTPEETPGYQPPAEKRFVCVCVCVRACVCVCVFDSNCTFKLDFNSSTFSTIHKFCTSSLETILRTDEADESLKKYKQTLLGTDNPLGVEICQFISNSVLYKKIK